VDFEVTNLHGIPNIMWTCSLKKYNLSVAAPWQVMSAFEDIDDK